MFRGNFECFIVELILKLINVEIVGFFNRNFEFKLVKIIKKNSEFSIIN